MASCRTSSVSGTLRSMPAESLPSASIQLAPRCTPTASSSVDSLTPVLSPVQDTHGLTSTSEWTGVTLHADGLQQRGQLDSRPLAGAGEAMRVLHREVRIHLKPEIVAVSGAFEKRESRDGGQALQVVQGEDQRPLDEPVNQQPVAGRIDQRDAV